MEFYGFMAAPAFADAGIPPKWAGLHTRQQNNILHLPQHNTTGDYLSNPTAKTFSKASFGIDIVYFHFQLGLSSLTTSNHTQCRHIRCNLGELFTK
jgi:hypothetical protein